MSDEVFGGGPGGTEYDEGVFQAGSIRADLCEIAQGINFQHGTKIVDAVLARFKVTPKPPAFKESP